MCPCRHCYTDTVYPSIHPILCVGPAGNHDNAQLDFTMLQRSTAARLPNAPMVCQCCIIHALMFALPGLCMGGQTALGCGLGLSSCICSGQVWWQLTAIPVTAACHASGWLLCLPSQLCWHGCAVAWQLLHGSHSSFCKSHQHNCCCIDIISCRVLWLHQHGCTATGSSGSVRCSCGALAPCASVPGRSCSACMSRWPTQQQGNTSCHLRWLSQQQAMLLFWVAPRRLICGCTT